MIVLSFCHRLLTCETGAPCVSDDAVSQMQEAISLIERNYPEPATSEFLASSSNRGLRVLVSSLSPAPSHGIVLSAVDEEELEKEGRGLWKWMSRSR